MLVLTRKIGESIVIGDVTIHVGNTHHGRVRLAVDAPSWVPILRGELVLPCDNDPDIASKPAEWSRHTSGIPCGY
jgi:carbon storage regulator CsrA